jgi:lysophospholipase L1-like esterase
MKKIVLIGDSIRMGYEPTVREELSGAAEIWAPESNGQHTVNLLLNFMEWVVHKQPDILHLNAGGWDTRNVIRGQPGNIVPLPVYRENVAKLLGLAKEHTRATIIWATITPIDQAQNFAHHAATGIPGRVGTDIPLYNAAAVEEAKKAEVEVNDLHRFVMERDPFKMRLGDGVHYTADGYAQLGKHVAGVLKRYL